MGRNKILDGVQVKLKESLRTLNLKRIEKQLNPIGLYSKSPKGKVTLWIRHENFYSLIRIIRHDVN